MSMSMNQQDINNSDNQEPYGNPFKSTQGNKSNEYSYGMGLSGGMGMDDFNEKISQMTLGEKDKDREKEKEKDSIGVANSVSAKTLNKINMNLTLEDKGDGDNKYKQNEGQSGYYNQFILQNHMQQMQEQQRNSSENANQILKRNSDKGGLGLYLLSQNAKQPSPMYSYYDTSQKYLSNSINKDPQKDSLNFIPENNNFIRKSSIDEDVKSNDYNDTKNPFALSNEIDEVRSNSNNNTYDDYTNNVYNPSAMNIKYNFFNSSQNNASQSQTQSQSQSQSQMQNDGQQEMQSQALQGNKLPMVMNMKNYNQVFRNSNNNQEYTNTNQGQGQGQGQGLGFDLGNNQGQTSKGMSLMGAGFMDMGIGMGMGMGTGMNNMGIGSTLMGNNSNKGNSGASINNQYGLDMWGASNFNQFPKPKLNPNINNDNNDYDNNEDDNDENKATSLNSDDYIFEKFGKKGWMCDKCNNFNFENRIKCNRCSIPKQPRLLKKKMNNPSQSFANPFKTPLPNPKPIIEEKKRKPFVERSGDWRCLNCHNLNFSFRLICNMCQVPKVQPNPNDMTTSPMNMNMNLMNPIPNATRFIAQAAPGQHPKHQPKQPMQTNPHPYYNQHQHQQQQQLLLQQQQQMYQIQMQQQASNPFCQNMLNNQYNIYNSYYNDCMQPALSPSNNNKKFKPLNPHINTNTNTNMNMNRANEDSENENDDYEDDTQ